VKLCLAVPSYGPIDPHIDKRLRAAIMTASNHGVTWAGDVSSVRLGWADGRDIAAKSALNTDADGVFWMDDDILIPPEAIIKLVSYGKDFTSGMYHQKVPPYWTLVAMFDGKSFQWLREYPDENVLTEVDGVGFGCCFTSTKLLRAIKSEYGKCFEWGGRVPQVKGDKTSFSEDFTFCLRAGAMDMKPWVDLSVKCGHSPLEPKAVTEADFLTTRQAMAEGEAASIVRVA
jgi:hypothetical protein